MQKILKLISIGLIIGVVLTLFFLGLELFLGNTITYDSNLVSSIGYNFLFSVVLTLINGLLFNYLNHKVVWNTFSRYRILIGAISSITLTMLGILCLRLLIEMGIEGESLEHFFETESVIYYAIALLITVVISTIFHAVYFYKQWQEKKVKEQKIIAGTASAKFDALKNQLDPHFLFNSLNVLTSLIEEDPDQAQKFTTSLSKVYRYVLEQKNKNLVTVEEELDFAKTYIRLLKMRFEDSIIFEIPDKSSNPDAKIIPLSLQLLLENAVKHNVVNSANPLHIRVFEDNNMLIISNNLQEKQVIKKSSGFGLRNIQQRYSILSDRQVIINKSTSEFRVELPMLTKQITVMETQQAILDDKRYQKAKERVETIKGFYGNLTAYCIVIPILIYINYISTSFPWVLFPILGWGFGVTAHGMEAFGYNPLWGKRWEDKKIREYMEDEEF